MQPSPSPFSRLYSAAKLLRYRWFGRAPSAAEWEERVRRVVQETVATALPWIPEEGAVLLDVGANIGIFTEEILRARPRTRAYLFEPVRAHFERCCERFAGMENVTVEPFALGDKAQHTRIWKPKHNPGGNVIEFEIVARRRSFMDFRPEEIECRVFDEYARERGITRVDFIKTDTEGYDSRVLRGMLGFLAACAKRPPILAELLREDIHPEYASQLALLEELYALGYTRVDLAGMQDVQDFLFLPQGARPGA
ncbi:MAG: FkbM family methyltransferase [Planctomycetes bacterium]|nr:FkbM family methyltransferase [Planctomycetota bacterium]